MPDTPVAQQQKFLSARPPKGPSFEGQESLKSKALH